MSKLVLVNDIGICPICDQQMEHIDDEYEGGEYSATYECVSCGIMANYISPDDREYNEYDDFEVAIELSKSP